VFQGGRASLAGAVAVQTEVCFMQIYKDQPLYGDIDRELRSLGMIPHIFSEVQKAMILPMRFANDLRATMNHGLYTDVLYVRDFTRPDDMSAEQLKHLALIAHYCYGSYDLAGKCIRDLTLRNAVAPDAVDQYLKGPWSSRRVLNLRPRPRYFRFMQLYWMPLPRVPSAGTVSRQLPVTSRICPAWHDWSSTSSFCPQDSWDRSNFFLVACAIAGSTRAALTTMKTTNSFGSNLKMCKCILHPSMTVHRAGDLRSLGGDGRRGLARPQRGHTSPAGTLPADLNLELTQEQAERRSPGAAGLRHGFEVNRRLADRAAAAGAINLPPPRLRRPGAVFDDNGKIGNVDHGPSCSLVPASLAQEKPNVTRRGGH